MFLRNLTLALTCLSGQAIKKICHPSDEASQNDGADRKGRNRGESTKKNCYTGYFTARHTGVVGRHGLARPWKGGARSPRSIGRVRTLGTGQAVYDPVIAP